VPETPEPVASENPHRPIWEAIFRDGDPKLKKFQRFNMRLPSPPRCKLCYAPYHGLGGLLMKFQGRSPSSKNPLYCSLCDQFLRNFPGGAEVDMTIVFADVRDSTGLSRQLAPEKFMKAMKNFYDATFPILNDHDGFIADVRSDSVVATFPPGFSGSDHAAKAIGAICDLLRTPVSTPDGSPLQFGIGAHTGAVWIGTMTGTRVGFEGVSAEGYAAIIGARLCAASGPGEALVSAATCKAANADTAKLEHRSLDLKGTAGPVDAYVFRA
jgi:adenylate cyclase